MACAERSVRPFGRDGWTVYRAETGRFCQGQTIRVRYMNEGLQIHSMHLHGIRQLVIAKDGYALPDPHHEDTVLIVPGERVDVLVEATALGAWAFHCHVLTHAEGPDGMFGMVTALIVEEP